jgi:uncharacterized membrane protein YhaH (DUF805 family)
MPILGLNPEDTAQAEIEGEPSGLLTLIRQSRPFSFNGRLDRRGFWVMFVLGHLAPFVLCLPFIFWAAAHHVPTGSWRFALAFSSISIGKAVAVTGIFAAGLLYYWILGATFAKRFRDLGLSGWVSLVFLIPIALAILDGTAGQYITWSQFKIDDAIFFSRYFWPILLLSQGKSSVLDLAAFYLAPYLFFLALLILQGTLKPSINSKRFHSLLIAVIALLCFGGVAESCYRWYGVYRDIFDEDAFLGLSLSVQAGRIEFDNNGITAIRNCHLFLSGEKGRQIEIPLLSDSVSDGNIQTRDFGILKIREVKEASRFDPGLFATRHQIAKLAARLAAMNQSH